MVKLLIAYDINKKDENKRSQVEHFLSNQTYHSKWVHIQGSIWVVLSKTSAEKKFQKLKDYLPNSLISIIDITEREVILNDGLGDSAPDGVVILKSDY